MKLLILFLFSGLFLPQGAFASSSLKSETKYIWSKIPFFEAGDFIAFREAYSKSRKELRKEYIEDAVDLIYAGAFGLEALEMVLAFDEQVTWLRKYSKVGINHAITSHFRGEFDKLTAVNNPLQHKMQFRQAEDAIALVQSVRTSLDPGFLNAEQAARVNYVGYGTYSTTYSGVKLSFHLIDVQNGNEVNFSSEGEVGRAVKRLAKEVFDYFYKTRFPSILTLQNGERITILWRGELYTASSAPFTRTWFEADAHCKDLGGRFSTLKELRSIDRAGDYRGGVRMNTRDQSQYYWALPYSNIYLAHTRTVNRIQLLNGAQNLNYLCVL